MDETELIQHVPDNSYSILYPKIDGECINKLKQYFIKYERMSEKDINNIFSNAYKVLPYIVDPTIDDTKTNKILCLGKVQSGKTSFFISAMALAFDNGYNLVYVIGGTKNKLKNQNYDRLCANFANNDKISIIDITKDDHDNIKEMIGKGKKVILVALKNTSESTNLGKVEIYSKELSAIPSIIIDDEGDECSPGAPKLKHKNKYAGKTHDMLSDILNNIKICTFLSVTATPQANFLISTIDNLSPDYAVLVEPGDDYTGGNAFHDTFDNKHVIEIDDSSDFDKSIPESFKNAFYFYIYTLLIQNYRNDYRPFSMLVHPSSLTKVQSMVAEKINDFFEIVVNALKNQNTINYDMFYNNIYNSGAESIPIFNDYISFKQATSKYINYVLSQMKIYEYNISSSGKQSMENEKIDEKNYKIYVGGNMLGRGLTIKNLNVTYIYRDSKIAQIDTMYQRARWFGYKKSYFDICRVYMTKELKQKFINIVENENDMWDSINSFLLTKTNIKQFPRLFTLNNDKLRLTRTTVAKTITVERINPGYVYDKSICLTEIQKQKNRNLYNELLDKYYDCGFVRQYGSSDIQQHLVVERKFTNFYEEFLVKYDFPRGSKFGPKLFETLLEKIRSGESEDKIFVIFMRYRTGEYRSPISGGNAIKELPQSYDNGTSYPGDKSLPGFASVLSIQIHKVFIEKSNKDLFIPIIALNNPITPFNVKYVTGDNYYETI